jgi:hypothetical protein
MRRMLTAGELEPDGVDAVAALGPVIQALTPVRRWCAVLHRLTLDVDSQ